MDNIKTIECASNRDFGGRFLDSTYDQVALCRWFYDHNGKGRLIKADNTIDWPEGSLDDIAVGMADKFDARRGVFVHVRKGSGAAFELVGRDGSNDTEKAIAELQAVAKETKATYEFKRIGAVVAWCGYKAQEFGKLRATDPALHAVINEYRQAFRKDWHDQVKALSSKILKVHNEIVGAPKKTRDVTPDFLDRLSLSDKKALGFSLEKMCRTAQKKGDTTAYPEWFSACWAEFVSKYKKGPPKTKSA